MRSKFFIPLAFFLAVTLLFSCKKGGDNDYYVKFKANGNWITWTQAAGELGPDLGDPSKTNLGVIANDAGATKIFDISIQVNGSDLPTGTYVTNSSSYQAFVSYLEYPTGSTAKFYEVAPAAGRPPSFYSINITSVTSNEIRGNFTGNYLVNITTGEVIEITEGEFAVRRVR